VDLHVIKGVLKYTTYFLLEKKIKNLKLTPRDIFCMLRDHIIIIIIIIIIVCSAAHCLALGAFFLF
jgi:hypothetical protein